MRRTFVLLACAALTVAGCASHGQGTGQGTGHAGTPSASAVNTHVASNPVLTDPAKVSPAPVTSQPPVTGSPFAPDASLAACTMLSATTAASLVESGAVSPQPTGSPNECRYASADGTESVDLMVGQLGGNTLQRTAEIFGGVNGVKAVSYPLGSATGWLVGLPDATLHVFGPLKNGAFELTVKSKYAVDNAQRLDGLLRTAATVVSQN
jgi:hypothetical protein